MSKAIGGVLVLDFVFHEVPAEVFTPRPFGLLRRSDSAKATFGYHSRTEAAVVFFIACARGNLSIVSKSWHALPLWCATHKTEMPAKAPHGGFRWQLRNGMRPV
jgi:hypothetical protein